MIELTIARHADAAWGSATQTDHDRPLSAKGRRDAARMATVLQEQSPHACRVICSTAVRARDTAAVYAHALGVALEEDERLYGAEPDALLAVAEGSGTDRILLVAHDPGLSSLAFALTGTVTGMPTAAILHLQWASATWAQALGRSPDSWSFDHPSR
ncbi:histidine phosphatase family protein [Microbacterium sp. cx-59]|uniref:SixA phosphatase family protein n=1 Tax=Microbacterium sp. cx-59 TaxID=2891207 RepID=UPI001E635594|nr:histidine phosphatase family protein [Microbacterium sp. cx-59]MCC4906687.1 histidine phosphatase family protein [Microbacterium sp. cx-59]